jgi:galactose mutarotase-like enzyme
MCPSKTPETLELRAGGGHVAIVPGRGALITHWQAAGKERLYLDASTLADPTKNVRGGVPLLFPSPGKLTDGKFSRAGKSGAMKQHGFVRDLAWAVAEKTDASVVLTLAASAETRALFPWEFALTLRVTITELRVRLALTVGNPGPDPLPFGFGIHPYFLVRDKAHATITTAATRAFDNVTKTTGPFTGFHLGEGETDLHLLDHGSTTSTLGIGAGERVTVRTSPEFGRWVVWTLPGKEFVCLEPWTAPGDALNTGDALLSLAPGASRDLWIELDAAA